MISIKVIVKMIKLQEKQEEEKEWEREKQVLGAYCIHSKPGSYPPIISLISSHS